MQLKGLRHCVWEYRDTILELVIIALIGWEIYIGISGGNQQLRVLNNLNSSAGDTASTLKSLRDEEVQALRDARQAIVDTGKQQQDALVDSRKALQTMLDSVRQQEQVTRQSLKTMQEQQTVLERQLETMRSLNSISQQQWNKANQQPAIVVAVLNSGESGSAVWSVVPAQAELSAGFKAHKLPNRLGFLIRNVGNTWLRKPRVAVNVESPGRLECLSFRNYNPDGDNPCKLTNIDLPDLAPDPEVTDPSHLVGKQSDFSFFVVVSFPEGTEALKVHFTASGDNLTAGVYSVHAHLMP